MRVCVHTLVLCPYERLFMSACLCFVHVSYRGMPCLLYVVLAMCSSGTKIQRNKMTRSVVYN